MSALLTTLLASTALAQEVAVPELNAQLYRPSLDARATMWTDDSGYRPDLYTNARLALGYVNAPFVQYRGDEPTELVSNALQANLLGAISYQRIRVGLDFPLYLASNSEAAGNTGAGLGDIAFDVKGTVLPREDGPVGVALGARIAAPSSTVDSALGAAGATWEIQAIADREFGPVLVAANLGTRGQPEVVLDDADLTLNDAFFYRLGGGYALSDASGASLDLSGQLNYATPLANPAGSPLEAMVGGWTRLSDLIVVRGGVGTGLTRGVGSPRFRAVAAIAYEPPDERDTDLDGLLDAVDACPEDPEDRDGYQDTDGCPDPSTQVTFRLEDESGRPVPGAISRLIWSAEERTDDGDFEIALHPGRYLFSGAAEGYDPVEVTVEVPAAARFEVTEVLALRLGGLVVKARDTDGQPVAGSWLLDGTDRGPLQDGRAETELRPGEYPVVVRAPGYKPARARAEVVAGQTNEISLTLETARAVVTAEKIEISEKVFFDTGKATIKSASYPLLDDVAALIVAHPEITLIKIEGHTDSRGSDSYNLKLSDDRAASVRQYLVDRGVGAERLESEGFGETRPIGSNASSAGREQNRRVDFFVAGRVEPEGAAQEPDDPWAPE